MSDILYPAEVRARVANIEHHRRDDEAARAHEDDLYERVLTAIRDGNCVHPRRCCDEALKSKTISFSRW